MSKVRELVEDLKNEIAGMEIHEKIEALNYIRSSLASISPFTEPVDHIRWVPVEEVQANDYNPNVVASPEMRLLHTSIKLDGYTQPIVSYQLENGKYEVVDGFHRNRVGKEYPDIRERIHGYLPLVVIDKPIDERIGSTIRHNRARGTHQIRSMSDIVLELAREGWGDEDICKKLGMELDEVIRFKQVSGLKEAFKNHIFSKSWEEFESKHFSSRRDAEKI